MQSNVPASVSKNERVLKYYRIILLLRVIFMLHGFAITDRVLYYLKN